MEKSELKCRSCGAKIVFLKTNKGGFMPCDYDEKIMAVNADGCAADDVIFDPKRHISHFATCKDADKWRKK